MIKNSVNLKSVINRYKYKDAKLKVAIEDNRFCLAMAKLIKELRIQAGLSQSQLAGKAQVAQPQIARIEKGDSRRNPTVATLRKILAALGYRLIFQIEKDLPIKTIRKSA